MDPRMALLLVTLAAGCGGGVAQSGIPTSPSAPAGPPLFGTTWNAVEIDGEPVNVGDAQRRPNILLSIDGNRVTGSTGCNRLSGTFTQEGSALRFGPLATTRMACVPDRSAAENAFTAAMAATVSQSIDNQLLELRDAAGTVRMRLRAQ